jgi:hypothetical protein
MAFNNRKAVSFFINKSNNFDSQRDNFWRRAPQKPRAMGFNAVPSVKKPYSETSDRTRDLLRNMYPINRSGTKQIQLSMDPSYEFLPALTFRKPGFLGVKLPHYASEKLLENLGAVNEFFVSGTNADTEVSLGDDSIIEFGMDRRGKRAIQLRSQVATMSDNGILINEQTWGYFWRMRDLVKHVYGNLRRVSPEVQRLYECIREKMESHFADNDSTPSVTDVEQYLDDLRMEALNFEPNLECPLDYQLVLLEIKRACVYDLLGSQQ